SETFQSRFGKRKGPCKSHYLPPLIVTQLLLKRGHSTLRQAIRNYPEYLSLAERGHLLPREIGGLFRQGFGHVCIPFAIIAVTHSAVTIKELSSCRHCFGTHRHRALKFFRIVRHIALSSANRPPNYASCDNQTHYDNHEHSRSTHHVSEKRNLYAREVSALQAWRRLSV